MGVSLFDASVTDATPGVLAKELGLPPAGDVSGLNDTSIVDGRLDVLRVNDVLDSSYIVGGEVAYWVQLEFQSNGALDFNTNPTNESTGGGFGPQFTDQAVADLGIILRFGGVVYSWRFSDLAVSDTEEPHSFSAASVAEAGQVNDAAFRNLLNVEGNNRDVLLVDRNHKNIDFDSLEYVTNPTVTISTTTGQTVDAGTAFPVASTKAHGGDGDTVTGEWTASPAGGAFADAAADDTTFTASPTAETEYTLTRTVEDEDGNTAAAIITVTVRSAGLEVGGSATLPGLTAQAGVELSDAAPTDVLALSDFDGAGLDTSPALALLVRGDASNGASIWGRSPRAISGSSLLDGEIDIPPTDEPINLIRFRLNGSNQYGSEQISFHDDGPIDLGTYFESGDGADLTLWIQTGTGAADIAEISMSANYDRGGGNFAVIDVPSQYQSVIAGIDPGDRFIIAMTRPTVSAGLEVGGTATLPGLTAEGGVSLTTPDLMPTAPTIDDQSAEVGTSFSFTLPAATGGDLPITTSADQLPAGLTLTNGVISGTPTAAGTTTVIITYTDDDGDEVAADFDIVVSPAGSAGLSLFDIRVTNATAGVALKGTVTPASAGDGSGTATVVHGPTTGSNINQQIDSVYVQSTPAYLGTLEFVNDGRLRVRLDDDFDSSGGPSGPQLTNAAEQNFGLAIRLNNGTIYKWVFDLLVASDTSEPYTFTSAAVDNAGPANNAALRTAINAASSVQVVIVNRNDAAIDWVNLRALATPLAPLAPSLTALPTSITVTLSHDPPSDAPITQRDVRLKRTADADTEWDDSSEWHEDITSPYTISGLTAETEYEVQWRAVSSIGDGAWSLSATITTPAAELMPMLPSISNVRIVQGAMLARTLPEATSGDLPITYSVSGLASWMNFDPSTRELTGAAPMTGTSTTTVTYTAVDDDGDSSNQTFDVIVRVMGSPVDTSGLLPRGLRRANPVFAVEVRNRMGQNVLSSFGVQAQAQVWSSIVQGGSHAATVHLAGRAAALDAAHGWLGHEVAIRGRGGQIVWYGYVNEVYTPDGVWQRVSSLDGYANALRLEYYGVSGGNREQRVDTVSKGGLDEARYGLFERGVSIDNDLANVSSSERAAILDEAAGNVRSTTWDSGPVSGAILHCVGYARVFDRRYAPRYVAGHFGDHTAGGDTPDFDELGSSVSALDPGEASQYADFTIDGATQGEEPRLLSQYPQYMSRTRWRLRRSRTDVNNYLRLSLHNPDSNLRPSGGAIGGHIYPINQGDLPTSSDGETFDIDWAGEVSPLTLLPASGFVFRWYRAAAGAQAMQVENSKKYWTDSTTRAWNRRLDNNNRPWSSVNPHFQFDFFTRAPAWALADALISATPVALDPRSRRGAVANTFPIYWEGTSQLRPYMDEVAQLDRLGYAVGPGKRLRLYPIASAPDEEQLRLRPGGMAPGVAAGDVDALVGRWVDGGLCVGAGYDMAAGVYDLSYSGRASAQVLSERIGRARLT